MQNTLIISCTSVRVNVDDVEPLLQLSMLRPESFAREESQAWSRKLFAISCSQVVAGGRGAPIKMPLVMKSMVRTSVGLARQAIQSPPAEAISPGHSGKGGAAATSCGTVESLVVMKTSQKSQPVAVAGATHFRPANSHKRPILTSEAGTVKFTRLVACESSAAA